MSEIDPSKIAFTYDAEKNPDSAALPGVPLRDLTVGKFLSLPAYMQASVRAQPFYKATRNAPKAEEPAPAPEAPAAEPAPARRRKADEPAAE